MKIGWLALIAILGIGMAAIADDYNELRGTQMRSQIEVGQYVGYNLFANYQYFSGPLFGFLGFHGQISAPPLKDICSLEGGPSIHTPLGRVDLSVRSYFTPSEKFRPGFFMLGIKFHNSDYPYARVRHETDFRLGFTSEGFSLSYYGWNFSHSSLYRYSAWSFGPEYQIGKSNISNFIYITEKFTGLQIRRLIGKNKEGFKAELEFAPTIYWLKIEIPCLGAEGSTWEPLFRLGAKIYF